MLWCGIRPHLNIYSSVAYYSAGSVAEREKKNFGILVILIVINNQVFVLRRNSIGFPTLTYRQ